MTTASEDSALLGAIKIAMEAEKKAATAYRDAAAQTNNPLGKKLFNKLTEFENYHYQKLSDLLASLVDEGTFIEYVFQATSVPAPGEVESIPEANKMSMMKIVTMAQGIEQKAEQRYADLAEQTADPTGKAMFEQLAKEEAAHYRLLREVYWNLNDQGTWSWPKELG
ncbi:MAG: ferritin family protein [Anaerolineae bacterium]|nr:ferritin family protein [Anaerolineae bacterium]